jgi:tetratricopeptide (TPR) repeat protein
MPSSRTAGRPSGAPGAFLPELFALPVRFLGLLALLLLGAYAASFANGFHYDDFHSLVENPHIRELGNLGRFFVAPELFSSLPERAMYRPLLLVSYALNYQFSQYALPGYHLVNWGLHLGCAFLVYLLGRLLLASALAAGVGALFFALHPLQVEVVNYISSRSESLAALACLLSLLAYARWRQGGPAWCWGVSLGALVCGLLSKSTAAVWPLVLALYEGMQPGPRRWRAHLGYWLATGLYLLFTQGMVAKALGAPVRPLGMQVLTQLKAGVYYLYLTAAPLRLSVEHPFAQAGSLLDLPVLGSLLLLVSLGGVLWRAGRAGLVWLLAGAALLALLPASLVPLNVLVNEHRPYLSLAFASLGLAALAVRQCRLAWLGGGLLLALGLLSHQRSGVWRDELTLWQDAVAKAPLMYRTHLHLGGALEEAGRLPEALGRYQRAAQLAPEAVETHYNLGNALRQAGRFEEARGAYARTLELQPDFFQALVNLGGLYLQAGQTAQAEPLLGRAAQLRPELPEVQLQLGVLWRSQGRLAEAEAAYQRVIALRPDLAEAYYNLANLYFDTHRSPQAIQAYQRTLALTPHPGAYYNLGDLYLSQGEYQRAAETFAHGLARLPGEAKLYYGLGRAQEGLGLGSEAALNYRAFLSSGQAPSALAEPLRQHLQEMR